MTTESDPRASPGHPGAGAMQAELDRYLKRSEAQAGYNAKRRPKSDEQRAREALRARLRKLGQKVEALAAQVEEDQTDRRGGRHLIWSMMKPPADNRDLRGPPARPGLLDSWERVEREAAAGCELSQACVDQFGPMLRLALELRHHRPPERAPDYDPMEGLSESARRYIEGCRVY